MSELAVVDRETGELVDAQIATPANLFGAADPNAVLDHATRAANALAQVIREKGLFSNIQGKSYVLVEAWTLLGSMLGVFPVIEWTRPMHDAAGKHIGWEARCEAKTRAGEVVGAAEAQCTREESAWSWEPTGRNGQKLKARDDSALRAMAQTRATSRALRGPLGFIVSLAGYSATAAEEMDTPHAPPERVQAEPSVTERKVTQAQQAKIAVLLKALEEKSPTTEGVKSWQVQAREQAGVRSRADLTVEQGGELIEWLEQQLEAAALPF